MRTSNRARIFANVYCLIAAYGVLLPHENLQAGCATAPSGIVSWWRGEANGLDEKGSNNGTLAGNTSFASSVVGQGFVFDGQGDAVSVGNPVNLQLQNFTIESWIKRSSTSIASLGSDHSGAIFCYAWGGYGVFLWDDGRLGLTKVGYSSVNSIRTITDTNFHHVAVTKSGSTVVFFFDGVPESSPAYDPGFVFNGPAAIGARGLDFVGSFLGTIDEVSVYERPLSTAEVQAIYNAGGEGKCPTATPPVCATPPAGLLHWWKAEGNTTDTEGSLEDVLYNGTTFAPGIVGQAFSFDGVQNSVINSSPGLTNVLDNYTMEFWVWPTAGRSSTPEAQEGIYGTSGQRYAIFPFNNITSPVGSGVSVGTNGVSVFEHGYAYLPALLVYDTPITNWTHIAVVYSNRQPSLYLNGVLVRTGLQSVNSSFPSTWLGENGSDSHNYGFYAGLMDEISIYNRSLTVSEIQTIYASGLRGKCAPVECAPVSSGIVSWWKAEGNTADQVGGNNGALVGNTTYGVGRVGQAFGFDGQGDAISLGNPTNLQLQNFTIETWVKRSNPTLASLGGEGAGNIFAYAWGGYGLGLWDNGVLVLTQEGVGGVTSSMAVTDTNNFHHVAVTKSGSNVIFYLDGKPETAAPYDPGFVFNGPAAIGARGLDYGAGFLGAIDEVSVYNRALTASEMEAVYAAGALGKCTLATPCTTAPPGIIGWWPGESNANDVVGGQNGTLQNSAAFASGEIGQAFNFDGANSFVQVPNSPTLNPGGQITVEGWMKASTGNSMDTIQGIVATDFYVLGIFPGRLGSRYGVNFAVSTTSGAHFDHVSDANGGGAPVSANEWHHIAGTYDGTQIKLYVDGQLWGSSVPVTGPISPMFLDSFLSIGSEAGRLSCPECVGVRNFKGSVDEVSLYNRALSASEIHSIYAAGSAGKCLVSLVAPFIVSQPENQSVSVGGTATFSIGAAGTLPLAYQWQMNGAPVAGATASSLVLRNVQFTDSGNYTVVITNAFGSLTSRVAALNVSYSPAVVKVVNTSAKAGRLVTVPILLSANGNENAIGFSLNYFPYALTSESVTLGSGASGATLLANTNQIGAGKLGLAISMPAGATFAAGTQELALISFTPAITKAGGLTVISFADSPIRRQLSDAPGNSLQVSFTQGTITIAAAEFEADVSPLPNGDRDVTITDWVLVGRYASQLDSPGTASEFQRADCAPRSNLGDGNITVTDWVQAGRYAAGLDPLEVAGGPSVAGPNENGPGAKVFGKKDGSPSRALRIRDALLLRNQIASVPVEMEALGNENALGFSISFNPAVLNLTGVTAGSAAESATLNINSNQVASGHVAVVLALPAGTTFAAGTKQLMKFNFTAAASVTSTASVAFADQPVRREVSDANTLILSANYINGAVTVNPLPSLKIEQTKETIRLAWPLWATNFTLQQVEGELAPTSIWRSVGILPTLTTNENLLAFPFEKTNKFYRLFIP